MIGKNIYHIRKSKGLTLTELAERADISKSYLSNIERDVNKNPSIKILEKLANVLDTDLQVLLIGTDFDHDSHDQDLIEFAHELREIGVEKDHIQDYRPIIEFLKWKSDQDESK